MKRMIHRREFPISIVRFEAWFVQPPRDPIREVSVFVELVQMAWSKVFSCRHKKCTPLITCRKGQPRSIVAAITGTYFVCLSCGKEFAYDWDNMKVIDPEPSRVRILAEKAAQMYAGK
jgi:hypothetical protein